MTDPKTVCMAIDFDPNNPFPLLASGTYTLAEAQAHARLVDAWLGLQAEAIEAELVIRKKMTGIFEDAQAWIGLPVQSMLTPYVELRTMLHELAPQAGTRVVDLGAAYGRMAWVIAKHHPGVEFIGYELVAERVREGLRAGAGMQLIQADLSLSSFRMPEAEIYFIYDFGSRDAIEKSLQDLRVIAGSRPITVVGRGRASRDAIERSHPWLSQIIPPRHTAFYSVYRSG
jgi:hypothetical protein